MERSLERSLEQLNTAIDARITKEDEFIRRITEEFRMINADLQRNSSINPQANLQPFIIRINEGIHKLNNRPSFGTDSNLDQLVYTVNGSRPPRSPPSYRNLFSRLNPFSTAARPNAEQRQENLDLLNGNYQDAQGAFPDEPLLPNDNDLRSVGGGKRTRGGWKSRKSTRKSTRKYRPKG